MIDAGSSSLGGVPACVADLNVIVTTPAIEPALGRVAIECVARVGVEPMLVLNRAGSNDLGEDDPVPAGAMPEPPGVLPGAARTQLGAAHLALERAHVLPDSRLGAQLALGGREARGGLGRAIAALVDRWEGGA